MNPIKILFPDRCPFCGDVITSKDSGICNLCRADLPFIGQDVCRICGVEKKLCDCRKRRYHCTRRTAPFYYEDLVRKGVVRYKKHKHFGGLDSLACLTAERIKDQYRGIEFDFIAYIPSSKSSIRERGFDQTKVLASRISKILGIPIQKKLLVRVFDGDPQKGMSKIDRIGNVAGVYDVSDIKAAEDKTVLLIDDVITTGATINECAKMLKIFGARYVYGAAICLGKKKQQS